MSRWSIAGVFVLTTVVAAAIPGAKIAGIMGALSSILFFWISVIGLTCIYIGLRANRARMLTILIGLYFLSIGLIGYYGLFALRVNQ